MKTLLISVGLTVITTIHSALNTFVKDKKRKGILYSTYAKRNNILAPIQEHLPGTTLLSLNIFEPGSIIRRKNKASTIRFANIISKPFIGIHTNEKSFRKHLAQFMYKNQEAFIKQNTFTKIVMIDEYSMPNTMLTKAAKNDHIVTIGIQHGIMSCNDKKYKEYKNRKKQEIVDYLLVNSEYDKKTFIQGSKQFNKDTVKAIGVPRYDILKKLKDQKYELRKKFGFEKDRTVVIWTTQTHGLSKEENQLNCKTLFSFFSQHKEYLLVIKLHPYEEKTGKLYRKYNKENGFCARIISGNKDINETIAASDLLLTKHSNTWVEALILGKPTLRLELHKNPHTNMFSNYVPHIITSSKNIEKSLIHAKKDMKSSHFARMREKFLKERFPYFGQSTEKAVEIIQRTA